MIQRPTVHEVLSSLTARASAGDTNVAEREAAFRDALSSAEPNESPWYVRILSGGAAWISAFLILLTIGLARIGDDPTSLFVLGLVGFGGAVFLRRIAVGEFAHQLALAISIAGRLAMYVAIRDKTSRDLGTNVLSWVFVAALEALTVFVYDDATGRFLATIACAVGVGGALTEHHDRRLWIELATLAVGAATTAVWLFAPAIQASRFRGLQRPVGFGLAASFFFAHVFDIERAYRWHGDSWMPRSIGLLAVGVVALLLLVERDVLRELARELSPSVASPGYRDGRRALTAARDHVSPVAAAAVYGTTLLLGVLAYYAPAIPSALLLLALAVHRRERLLFGLAAVFLVLFGSYFYYSLEMTLLAKSGVLLGSGILLLVARLLVANRPPPASIAKEPV